MISPSMVQMWRKTDRPFGFDCYKKGKDWKWRASCQFSLRVSLHPNLQPVERNAIEYRQFITGGIWVRYHSIGDWTALPNFNQHVPIPPYAPQHSLPEMPTVHVPGQGLSWDEWKEDGKGSLKYGYRTNQPMFRLHERDQWMEPNMETGSEYYLRDTRKVADREMIVFDGRKVHRSKFLQRRRRFRTLNREEADIVAARLRQVLTS